MYNMNRAQLRKIAIKAKHFFTKKKKLSISCLNKQILQIMLRIYHDSTEKK